jgi:phosphoglycolate phosphatase
MTKLVMFDLDGTLIDTKDDLAATVNALRVRRGLPEVDLDTAVSWVGDGAPVLVARATGVPEDRALAGEDAADALAFFKEHYAAHMFDRARVYPGVPETLETLRATGLALAVVSNKPEAMCARMLERFGLDTAFANLVGGDTLATKKPHPGPLLHVLARTDTPPGEAVIVGDGAQDLLAGRAAGVTTVAALYGFRTREILEPTRPDHWIETVDELTRIV